MAQSGSYVISISAVDQASKVFGGLNKQLAQMRAPTERLNKEFGKFTKLSGLKNVTEGFGKIGRSAIDAAKSLSSISSPLGAITGASSLAGMAALATHVADFANGLTIAASRLGLTTSQLYTFQSMGKLAGAGADAFANSLESLGDKMQNALAGRDPMAMQMFANLGISIRQGAGLAAKNAKEVMPQVWDAIKLKKQQGASDATLRFMMSQLGIDPKLFKIVTEEGAAGLAKLQTEAKKYGWNSDQATESATSFYHAQQLLNLSIDGFGNIIGSKLFPILTPLITKMADWVVANRDWIANDITKYVQEFVEWCQKAWPTIQNGIKTVNDVAQAFGGWKVILGTIVAMELAGFASRAIGSLTPLKLLVLAIAAGMERINHFSDPANLPVGSPFWSQVSDKDQGNYVNSPKSQAFLHSQGSSAADQTSFEKTMGWLHGLIGGNGSQSGGVSGSGRLHGSMQPPALPALPAMNGDVVKSAMSYFQSKEGGGWTQAQAAGMVANIQRESQFKAGAVGDSGHAFGLGQWHEDRQENFKKLFGHDIRQGTMQEQLAFYNWELNNTEKGAGDRLRKAQTAEESGSTVSQYDERPADRIGEANLRGNLASQIALANPVPSPVAPATTVNGKVSVDINHNNAPAGSTVTASTQGDILGAPRVNQSMMAV